MLNFCFTLTGRLNSYYDTGTIYSVFQILLLDSALEIGIMECLTMVYSRIDITKWEQDTQNDWKLCGPRGITLSAR